MGVTIRIHQDTGGGTGGAVDSFNGRIGFVVSQSGDYTTAQVMQTPDKNYVTDAEKLAIANTSGQIREMKLLYLLKLSMKVTQIQMLLLMLKRQK